MFGRSPYRARLTWGRTDWTRRSLSLRGGSLAQLEARHAEVQPFLSCIIWGIYHKHTARDTHDSVLWLRLSYYGEVVVCCLPLPFTMHDVDDSVKCTVHKYTLVVHAYTQNFEIFLFILFAQRRCRSEHTTKKSKYDSQYHKIRLYIPDAIRSKLVRIVCELFVYVIRSACIY